jgi:hypothetical protein
MYKIIGADDKEYGPVSEEKIREWLKESRVNSQTRIQSEGSTGWKPLGEFTEFKDMLAGGAAPPPVLPSGAPVPSQLSALAIASLVLGILGWVTLGLTALIGLVLGIIALVRISRSGGALRGKGLALAGTIVSGVFVLMLPILAALLLPALAQAKARAQSIVCMTNMKQLALGGILYAGDNKDQLPSGANWCDAIGKYVPNPKVFQCPSGDANQRCHYAFNARLSGVDTKTLKNPSRTVLMFETDGGWNLSGGPELTLSRPRHRNVIGMVFADGHSEITTQSRLRNVRWDP